MNRFMKLLEWEISRFGKIYLALCSLTIVVQFAGLFFTTLYSVFSANKMVKENAIPVEMIPPIQINVFKNSLWFGGPILISVSVLVLYVFFIWYREWWGKNTFAYRLLMLPTSRMNIYMAKVTAIMVFVFGLVALQIVLLALQNMLFNMIVPIKFLEKMALVDLIRSDFILSLLLPKYFIQFLYHYGTGAMFIVAIFTIIMLERSFRWKGIIAGIGYAVVLLGILWLPQIINILLYPKYWFNIEVFIIEIIIRVLLIAISLWLSSYLLRKRISV
ncbi:hypothetical protein E0485_01185 [Paenibacillus albiflavus]|uniref:Uncharacterized protein n=1 Tax=Paenibacillus albiflavus TaxID=2545760 RepID=A0A4R4ENC7_9BACL|nr:hypothetical protein [Paenibacillus albiflavus]TCZ80930.1 hypothetical protein E0485_01185 [Paenibacillus albiflavus]